VHTVRTYFALQDQVSALDILLDRKKPYPLLCRPQAEGGNVSPEYIFSGIICAGL